MTTAGHPPQAWWSSSARSSSLRSRCAWSRPCSVRSPCDAHHGQPAILLDPNQAPQATRKATRPDSVDSRHTFRAAGAVDGPDLTAQRDRRRDESTVAHRTAHVGWLPRVLRIKYRSEPLAPVDQLAHRGTHIDPRGTGTVDSRRVCAFHQACAKVDRRTVRLP